MRLVDSFAWIEYFIGSPRASGFKAYVEQGVPLYTPSICLTEVKARYLREGRNPELRLEFIGDRSFVVPLDEEIALDAADLKQKRKLHTVDAVVYATALRKNLVLLTGDQHFNGLPNVEMI